MRIRAWWLCGFALSAWPTGILAGATPEKGQGGIVVSAEATVYGKADGTDPQCTLKRGDAVTGMGTGMNSSTNALFGGKMNFFLEEKNGYAHVGYFCPGKDKHNHTGWMRPADLSKFLYE